MTARRQTEQGQMTIMILGFGVVILLLITSVIAASQVFVQQRAIHSAADGAALAGTDGIDPSSIYTGGVGDEVELDEGAAQTAVDDYLAQLARQGERENLGCGAEVAGDTVTVHCSEVVPIPFLSNVMPDEGGTVQVDVTASSLARSQG